MFWQCRALNSCLKEVNKDMWKLKKQVQCVEEKQDNKASNSMTAGSADNMFICMRNIQDHLNTKVTKRYCLSLTREVPGEKINCCEILLPQLYNHN